MTEDDGGAWLGLIALAVIFALYFCSSTFHYDTNNFISDIYYNIKFSLGFKLPIEFNSTKDKKILKEKPTIFYWKNYQEEKTAGTLGNVLVENNLGIYFEKRKSIEDHLNIARLWYTAASEKGYGPAQYNLGRLYYYRKTLRPINNSPCILMLLAKHNGSRFAKFAINLIKPKLSTNAYNSAFASAISLAPSYASPAFPLAKRIKITTPDARYGTIPISEVSNAIKKGYSISGSNF